MLFSIVFYGTNSHKFSRIQASNVAADPFIDCLSDSKGEPLRFTPENQPTPPRGDGTQLCYRALPHYEATVKKRSKDHREKSLKPPKEIPCDSVAVCQCQCRIKNCKMCKLLRERTSQSQSRMNMNFLICTFKSFTRKSQSVALQT